MKVLRMGSTGEAVRQLQGWLNLIPGTKLAALVVDGIYGLKTTGRVREFQGQNKLVADGEAGPLTLGVIQELLKGFGGQSGVAGGGAVRPITKEILGLEGPQNLIDQIIPPISVLAEATYRKNDDKNRPQFGWVPGTVGRLGIFAAKKNGVERAVILLVPKTAVPDTTLVCITQEFAQATEVLESMGWGNPLSPALIQYCLMKHVVTRWGAQVLTSRKPMAFVYIVRAKGDELGPFASDGAFLKQVLGEMAALTGNAFGFGKVEAMTFSSGIFSFNRFLKSLAGHLPLTQIYNLDPTNGVAAAAPPGVSRREFTRMKTGQLGAGFDHLPLPRWENEWLYTKEFKPPFPSEYQYLHNHCMAMYALRLGLQTS